MDFLRPYARFLDLVARIGLYTVEAGWRKDMERRGGADCAREGFREML